MELVHIMRAIRRYWWLTTIVVVAAVLGGLTASSAGGGRYEAEASLLVSPTGESAFGGTSTDRYVQNQLVVLDSENLAGNVAEVVDGYSVEELQRATAFEQVAGTDIIMVSAASTSAEDAQAIANAYVNGYVELSESQAIDAIAPELAVLESELEDAREQLDAVNVEIREVLALFRLESDEVPSIDQVDPGLASENELFSERVLQLTQARNELIREQSQLRAGSRVLQLAPLPTGDGVGGTSLMLIASVFVGLVLGGLAAVAMAALSGRVLDRDEVAEALGTPIAGALPTARAVTDRRRLLIEHAPSSVRAVVHELCVRSEARAADGAALTVAVVGTDAGAGATTIAAAMAAEFSLSGSEVVLIDADRSNPELTRLTDVLHEDARSRGGHDGGSTHVIDVGGTTARQQGSESDLDLEVRATGIDGLSIGHLAPENARIRRDQVSDLLTAATELAPVVVVDTGDLMGAASSVQLAKMVDVVVVAVPIRRQRSNSLRVIGQELRSTPATVLPVVTPARRSSKHATRDRAHVPGGQGSRTRTAAPATLRRS